MDIFNFNVKKYALLLTPPFKRSPVFIAFLTAFVKPLSELYKSFLASRKQNLIKLQFNYQVCSLEYRLNDRFDPIERRITIDKSVLYQGVYLYTEAEDDQYHSKTKWINDDTNPIYLRTESELYSEYDFTVNIPNTSINMFQLRAEIDFYKLPTKRYQVIII